jgi:hypothetical protein
VLGALARSPETACGSELAANPASAATSAAAIRVLSITLSSSNRTEPIRRSRNGPLKIMILQGNHSEDFVHIAGT